MLKRNQLGLYCLVLLRAGISSSICAVPAKNYSNSLQHEALSSIVLPFHLFTVSKTLRATNRRSIGPSEPSRLASAFPPRSCPVTTSCCNPLISVQSLEHLSSVNQNEPTHCFLVGEELPCDFNKTLRREPPVPPSPAEPPSRPISSKRLSNEGTQRC